MHRGKGGREFFAQRLCSVHGVRQHVSTLATSRKSTARRDMRIRLFRGRPLVVAALSLASAVAIAQVRPDAGQILEQTREPLRLPPPADADVRPKAPEPRPALPVSPTLKVRVTKFTFSGNTLYSDEELAVVVRDFVGKELD